MVEFWSADLRRDRKLFRKYSEDFIKKMPRLDELKSQKEWGVALSPTEQTEYAELEKLLPKLDEQQKVLQQAIFHKEDYVDAAECLLQAYENNGELTVLDNPELAESLQAQLPALADMLMTFFKNGTQWESVSEEDRMFVQSVGSIFKELSDKRAAAFDTEVEVEVAG
jgi:restriction endonuclease S subunit